MISRASSGLQLGLTRALESLGDRSSTLVLRAALDGADTFSALRAQTGLVDGVLAIRITHLLEHQLLERSTGGTIAGRDRYLSTPLAGSLWQVRVSAWRWDRTWEPATPANRSRIVHQRCGKSIVPAFGCGGCAAIGVTPQDVSTTVSEDLRHELNHPASRRRVRIAALPHLDAGALLGDTWSMAVLGSALLGVHSFSEFKSTLGSISTATLSERLHRFTSNGLLDQVAGDGARRQPYRLTPKARSFFPVFATLADWSQQFADDPGMTFEHIHCGQRLQPRYTCNSCNGVLDNTTTVFTS